MTIQITREIEQLARLVANKTGQTPDDIIKEAVEARALAAGVSIAKPRKTAGEIERGSNRSRTRRSFAHPR